MYQADPVVVDSGYTADHNEFKGRLFFPNDSLPNLRKRRLTNPLIKRDLSGDSQEDDDEMKDELNILLAMNDSPISIKEQSLVTKEVY